MQFNYEKFKDLVHYICHIADRDKLGAVKLNKILWFSDVVSYVARDEPLTGATYIKRDLGPVPRDILRAIEELVRENKLVVRDVSYYGNTKTEYITLQEPDLSNFSASEISLVDKVAHDICHHHTAKSISEKTHNIIWKLAGIGEEIPYYAVYAAELGEITEEAIEWARNSIEEDEGIYSKAS
ncbi:MAG: Panacea domain-containing protein [Syntrophobacteraceae bacterium]